MIQILRSGEGPVIADFWKIWGALSSVTLMFQKHKNRKPHITTFLLLASFLLPIPITFFILFYISKEIYVWTSIQVAKT